MKPTRKGRPNFRPSLESLESRLTPAAVQPGAGALQGALIAEAQAGVDQAALFRDLGHAANGLSQDAQRWAARVKSEVTKLARELNVVNQDVAAATEEAPDPGMKADVMKLLQGGFSAVRNFLTGQFKAARQAVQRMERAVIDYFNRLNQRVNDIFNMSNEQSSVFPRPSIPPSTLSQIRYRGNFTGSVQNSSSDSADPDGAFTDSYGGPATLTVTASPGGGYTLLFSASLNTSRPHGESFAASPNGTLTVASLAGVSFRFPMGDGNCAVQGTFGNGVFSGSWRFVQVDSTDNSDSGSGTFALNLSASA